MSPRFLLQDASISTTKSAVCGLFTTSALLIILHFSNQLQLIGNLQSFYIPVFLVLCDIVKLLAIYDLSQFRWSKQTKWYFLKGILLTLISIVSYFILAILFGAKALSEHEETFMLAVLLAICTTVHCLINGSASNMNTLTILQPIQDDCVLVNSVQIVAASSIIGCWVSAVVIPLDWERWWQKWPIPSMIGTLLGYNIGFIIVIMLCSYTMRRYKDTNIIKRKRDV